MKVPVKALSKRYALLPIIVLGVWLSLNKQQYSEPSFYFPEQVSAEADQPKLIETTATDGGTASVHSATAIELDNGNLLAMWYGGTREGHTDVSLYKAVFDQSKQAWIGHEKVLDRYDISQQLNRYIKKVGNPVLVKHPAGPVVLFYVTVSLGGWATSQVNMAVSYDDGQSWHSSKRLVTSPFINISTLVKNDAVIYQDGTIGITGYHELFGEFSEMIRVNLQGEVINKYRITDGDYTIQPTVIVQDPDHAVALIRDSSRHTEKVHYSKTSDGGKTWSDYEKLAVDNPNSAVYGFKDNKDRLWMLFNEATRQVEFPRNTMALAVSTDNGKTWTTKHYFENPGKDLNLNATYGYPWVTVTTSGDYHVFYTRDRESIVHHQFNQAWLEALL
ncbi:exo-alpha-sialidase [Bermanella marisrubri]|uniref:BNR/Asp-box repeat protein n=1 Tax=Bermanella marisrubri TaxID=207949 RepID=Q1MY76_9GAMM|nr:sialidase family protein [Bermanella marisrubri]EAT10934.1 BNR/Asp-box repeat protein [Oceanobacter sp. RED65] [Bermanella marisrubri]QIZ83723.1 exo-alpha-sialidase [Bermanella marisrubri]